jgi:hypothetical protein
VETRAEVREGNRVWRETRRRKKKMTYDKAKREPRMRLDDTTTPVTAVVTLAGHALVALDFLAESVLSAGEDETHGGCGCAWIVVCASVCDESGDWYKSIAAGSCT